MAEALLSSGVKLILSAVESHIKSEIALAWGAKRELEKLQEKLVILQLVLDNAEKRQVKEASVRHWLERLKSVAYEANHPENNINVTNHWIDKVLSCCSVSNPFLFQRRMAHMIQDINGEFEKIKKEMEEYKFIEGNVPLGPYNPSDEGDVDDDGETHSSSSVNEYRQRILRRCKKR